MSSYKLFDDPFTQWLKEKGTKVGTYQPGGFMGRPPIGRQITVGRSTIVYRVVEEKPDELIVVLFERQGERSGLRSPFADFARFVAMVRKSPANIRLIRGHVDVLSDLPKDHVPPERIAAFYKRYLDAHHDFVENGVEWVAGDITHHVPPLYSGRQVMRERSAPETA